MKSFLNKTSVRTTILVFASLVTYLHQRSFAQPSPGKKQEIYNLLVARRYKEAVQSATAYLATAPGDCNGTLFLGLAYRGEGELAPASQAFRVALHECPQSLAALEGAAETAFLLKTPDAKDLVKRVIQARPQEETGYAMLGSLDASTGDCAGAVANYGKAPTKVQGSQAALREYGACLVTLDRAADAVPLFSHLVELQDNSTNRIALARTQAAAKDGDAALATLQPLLSESARDSVAFLLAAELAEANNQTPQAVEWFRKAIELNPKDATAYLAFAEMSFNHGAFKVGVDFLTIGIQQLPSEARLYLARGVLEEQMTQMDAALHDFEEAHRFDPQLSFAQDAIGMLFSQKHDTAAALKLFEGQSKVHPDDPLLQYLYAEALSQVEDPDQATVEKTIAAAQRAVHLEPGYQPARDLLCVLLLRHNDFDGVVAQAEEATKRNPYDEVALYQELLAEHKLHHADRAAILVKLLQEAKAHNQETKTKFILQEAQSPQAAKSSNN
ncbi:MAG TPA: tetratricopeptide repeat protein [Acidobacteriaceae bacterium]|nr:tetratricopeptide repeat protein [Acidobacteriaceae bacterium]